MTQPPRPDSPADDVRTIGVAIAVPPPYGPELQGWRRSFGDPMADFIPPHVTLLPPTDVGAGEMRHIDKHLTAVAASGAPFEMHLRGTATFRPVSPVVFVGLVRGISHCEMLANAVRTGPLLVELHFPYHPHVTVAHNVTDDSLDRAFTELADFEAKFQVDAFGLYEHRADGMWVQQRTFPLG